MANRLNFLFFLNDQLRADHVGFGGNPIVRTPNIDGIAKRGVRFDRAFVADPICMPNRASIMTGRFPSAHGVLHNGVPLDCHSNTFADVLIKAGYQTALFGKCHLQNMYSFEPEGEKKKVAGEEARFEPGPEGWDQFENMERHRREYVKMPDPYYGLKEVDLVIGHADRCSGHYYQWLLERLDDPRSLQGPKNTLPYDAKSGQIWRTAVSEELYPTSYITGRVIEFLERQAKKPEQPFFAFCSYPDPHHPFTPPGRYFEMYDPKEMPLPDTFDDPHTDSMPHYKRHLSRRGKIFPEGVIPFAPTPDQYRDCVAAQYGAITMIDDAVGRVLASLEELGLAERTVIVFTSDHGDMMGDHGVMLKGAMHYQGCLRVPLAIAVPGHAPGASPALVSTIDLAPTLLDLAGCDPFYGMQGATMRPLLDDPAGKIRDHLLIEENQQFSMIERGGPPLRMRTLMTEHYRFTAYRGYDHGELFDLESDPSEMKNLFSRPEGRALREEAERQLIQQMLNATDDPIQTRALA